MNGESYFDKNLITLIDVVKHSLRRKIRLVINFHSWIWEFHLIDRTQFVGDLSWLSVLKFMKTENSIFGSDQFHFKSRDGRTLNSWPHTTHRERSLNFVDTGKHSINSFWNLWFVVYLCSNAPIDMWRDDEASWRFIKNRSIEMCVQTIRD